MYKSRLFRLVTLASVAVLAGCQTDAITNPGTRVALDVGDLTNSTPEYGKIKLCKSALSNVGGVFALARLAQGAGANPVFNLIANLAPGICVVIAEDVSSESLDGSNIRIGETSLGFQSVSGQRIDAIGGGDVISDLLFTDNGTVFVNQYHGVTITYLNFIEPPAVCDFITFGRLVTTVDGKKVVISGNAGGKNADGSIKGEFHVEYNGVDNHVSDVDTYGPITDITNPLFGLANSRIVTGTAKNGNTVELSLWDGGEPGKNTDKVYVKINGVAVIGPQFINQGNMQYHSNCRGPGE